MMEKSNHKEYDFDFNDFENITTRKKYVSQSSESLKSFETSNSEYLAKSLPDISTIALEDDIIDLREEIKSLKIQLESAHIEIENLSVENNSLKNLSSEQQNIISYYKKIYSGSPEIKNKIKKKKLTKKLNITHLKAVVALRYQHH